RPPLPTGTADETAEPAQVVGRFSFFTRPPGRGATKNSESLIPSPGRSRLAGRGAREGRPGRPFRSARSRFPSPPITQGDCHEEPAARAAARQVIEVAGPDGPPG